MNLSRKSVLSFAGVTAAALLLAVASPRTVHALGEQLVSIANTATHLRRRRGRSPLRLPHRHALR